ncbi:ABC transporter ATP-binding protein/permease [Faecalicoccus pleomorphus]|uniref:ABC transporter ATP-binding protein/permease n=1 Tax=Faecalicoccus pleomorphus TaxID=1323 RepID=A0A7X9RIE2_9FIRM|nr:ABC transporter ATP-binding protein/permease [Faecalicoccus pleomorphus]NME44287.1 ABC transporter ATP-binding protein/permease [Faecalicoccus pleomorphus]
MLEVRHLVKDYDTGSNIVHALKDISLTFRDSEFVSILGQSGCGKTTFLNIIGGLDQYTSGDLIINGRSTKNYTDKDWDTYRNHRVGFVFQSYNLIMHQTVLSNVELALTLSGVDKQERRQRAIEVLKQVGLEDQLDKKPTQMSGGQMQRVAIARALVNNPEILLADEPTGALDSKTSVQIMDLLKEIAKDRLVIIVTHNPELAKTYSTRIISLFDGVVQNDTNPIAPEEITPTTDSLKKPSMSFKTALSLSLNNLMTKKGRTLLTSFAGSIGIIGIALILSLSNGVQAYINQVENDTMASYPIEIQDNTMDMSTMMETMMNMSSDEKEKKENKDEVTSMPYINDILNSISKSSKNNLSAFKSYLESKEGDQLMDHTKAVEYDYGLSMHVYNDLGDQGLVQVSPNGLLDRLGFSDLMNLQNQFMSSSTSMMSNEVWLSLPDTKELRDDEFELVEGKWPDAYNEVVIEVNDQNEISDYVLYSLGLMDQDELVENYNQLLAGNVDQIQTSEDATYTYDELLNTTFKLVNNSDLYHKVNGVWIDGSQDEAYVDQIVDQATDVKIVGIIKPADSTVSKTTMGGVYYSSQMRDYMIEQCSNSQIVQEQINHPDTNVLTGTAFSDGEEMSISKLTPEQQMAMASMSQEELMSYMSTYNENLNATYDSNLQKLGYIDLDNPTKINIYASSFEDKEEISDLINEYNEKEKAADRLANVITYNDFIGMMLSSVTSVINMISYVLIGFVSVSLIVSSIMIGIITYISVLERTKEIGILRAIGASKKDVSHVFNAETFIIGLASGCMGILITILLNIPISMIVENLTGVAHIASLPWQGGLILILISLLLTVIAGLIPSRFASKKDPVEALRSE